MCSATAEAQRLYSLRHSGVPGGDGPRTYIVVCPMYRNIQHTGYSTQLTPYDLLEVGRLGALTGSCHWVLKEWKRPGWLVGLTPYG